MRVPAALYMCLLEDGAEGEGVDGEGGVEIGIGCR